MAHARAIHELNYGNSIRRYSVAMLLLVVIASSLVACGGGASESAAGGGSVVVVCATGPSPVALEWDPVNDPNLAGYRIYYGTAGGAQPQSVNVGNFTTYTVTGLSSGTTYYFAATAYDGSSPPNESGWSNIICRTIS